MVANKNEQEFVEYIEAARQFIINRMKSDELSPRQLTAAFHTWYIPMCVYYKTYSGTRKVQHRHHHIASRIHHHLS